MFQFAELNRDEFSISPSLHFACLLHTARDNHERLPVSEYNDADTSSSTSAVDELHGHRMRYDSGLDTAIQEQPDRLTTPLAVVESPVIDVHADEGIGVRSLQAPRVAHRVIEGTRPVLQSISDAVSQVT